MSRAGRNKVSRKAARFIRRRDGAWIDLEQARKYYVTFSQMGREKDTELTRREMHDLVDVFCDMQRGADIEMGGRTNE